jgi:hypothetical protein
MLEEELLTEVCSGRGCASAIDDVAELQVRDFGQCCHDPGSSRKEA